jgi:hypothetical protein
VERYVEMPARIYERNEVEPESEPKPKPKLEEPNPAWRIEKILAERRPQDRKHVVIEAPGGHGKSALLREVIRSICYDQRYNPKIPLPVLCSDSGGEIEEMVARALAKCHIDHGFLKEMLEAGDFVIFIDDPSEMGVKAETISKFVTSTAGDYSRLVVAMRPDEELRKVLKESLSWIRFEPLPLTEETLVEFVKAYGRSSLDDDVKDACRSREGKYLQILVRLAIIIGDKKGVTSKDDLYHLALDRLLRDKFDSELVGKIRRMAINLCLTTYWKDGSRQLTYGRNDVEEETMQLLRTAGILIEADSIHLIVEGAKPRTVRFFHDSIQSYLTACGLEGFHGSEEGKEEGKNVLWEAAGDERFLDAPINKQAASQSELFEMCIEVFINKEELLKHMVRDLRWWANQYGNDIAKNKVLQAVPSYPPELRKQAKELASGDHGAGFALKKAVDVCLGYSDCESREIIHDSVRVNGKNLYYIAELYGGLAPMTWKLKLKREKTENTPPTMLQN